MTEDEAKTKTCHKTLTLVSGEMQHFHLQACIGSACMAWRWLHPGFDHDKVGNPIELQPAEGFCGLAGKP